MVYDNYNANSQLFPNQAVTGHMPDLYPPIEKDNPRRYHEKLKEKDKRHLYPDLYKDDEKNEGGNDSGASTPVTPPSTGSTDPASAATP